MMGRISFVMFDGCVGHAFIMPSSGCIYAILRRIAQNLCDLDHRKANARSLV